MSSFLTPTFSLAALPITLSPSGVGDQSARIEAALVLAEGGKLILGEGTWTITSPVDFTDIDNVEVEASPGAIFDFSTAADSFAAIKINGDTGSSTTMVGNGVVGQQTITVADGSIFTADGTEIAMLLSDESFNDDVAGFNKGEIIRVLSRVGNVLTLLTPLIDAYDDATHTITITKINPRRNVTWKGGQFIGKDTGGSQQIAFQCNYTDNVTVRDTTITYAKRFGIAFTTGIRGKVLNNVVFGSNETGIGYGTTTAGMLGMVVSGNHYTYCRHGVDVGGGSSTVPEREWIISNNTATGCTSAGLSCHGHSPMGTFEGNTILMCGGGIVNRSPEVTIVGNVIKGCMTSAQTGTQSYVHGIWVTDTTYASPSGTRITIIGNMIDVSGDFTGGHSAIYCRSPLVDSVISGNVCKGFTGHGIVLEGHTNSDSSVVNNVVNCSAQVGTPGTTQTHGIYVFHHSSATGDYSSYVTVANNNILAPLYAGIRFDGGFASTLPSTGIEIRDNNVRAPGSAGKEVWLTSGFFDKSMVLRDNGLQTPYILPLPTNSTYLAWNVPGWIGGLNSTTPTSGTVYLNKVWVPAGPVTGAMMSVGVIGNTVTHAWYILYDPVSKAQLAVTADSAATFHGTTGLKPIDFTGVYYNPYPRYLDVGWLGTATTTMPSLSRITNGNFTNAGLATADALWGTADTAQTSVPNPFGTKAASGVAFMVVLY